MASEQNSLPELIGLRARLELLEQDLSQATHLLYCLLVWVATSPESEFKRQTLGMLRAKFLQMPQGFRLGQALVELDGQFGNKLVSHGLDLNRLIFEPRGHRHE